tara:strand:+ start:923 stop:2821 length:1899 start_codon:yes stop_codon:yes gene_type:complete
MVNKTLENNMKNNKLLDMDYIQTYFPIYDTIYNDITNENVYNKHFPLKKIIDEILEKDEDSYNKFTVRLLKMNDYCDGCNKEELTQEDEHIEQIFIKFSPIMNAFKYAIGKYHIDSNIDDDNSCDEKINSLPKFIKNKEHPDNIQDIFYNKINNYNNSSYVDCFFTYLSGLLYNDGFVNGINFYGSYLGIQNNCKINVSDDLAIFTNSEYFIKNVGVKFDIIHLNDNETMKNSSCKFKKRINIEQDNQEIPVIKLDTDTFPSDEMEQVFSFNNNPIIFENISLLDKLEVDKDDSSISLIEIKDNDEDNENVCDDDDDSDDEDDDSDDGNSSCSSDTTNDDEWEDCEYNNSEISDDENNDCDDSDDDSDDSDESSMDNVLLNIKKFPVVMICMENCENTLDHYMLHNNIDEEEWSCILMQIIMTLIVYQDVFSLTHNDLHTNNIMYIETKEEYLYYYYNNTLYKVPTYGKIYKIIDYDRSIYKYNKRTYFSDSYDKGGDAYTQYNCEPFFNDNKSRLEPNASFDLCRLGCSMIDYFIENVCDMNKETDNPITKLILEWCTDDKGRNILYKTNGEERYIEFKLYKMIARSVHNHTPHNQLKRDIFKKFIVSNDNIQENNIMDIQKYKNKIKNIK